MPGTHMYGPGKPMDQRSTAAVVRDFLVFPPLLAAVFTNLVVPHYLTHVAEMTGWDWFWAAWMVLLVSGLGIGLPVVGWEELRRRRKKGKCVAKSKNKNTDTPIERS